ncbi:MAG: hypothetical protein ACRDMH_02820 [Solirubrobacterales bacterium]
MKVRRHSNGDLTVPRAMLGAGGVQGDGVERIGPGHRDYRDWLDAIERGTAEVEDDRERFIWREGDLQLVGVGSIRVRVERGANGGQLVYRVTDESGDLRPFYVWREDDRLWLADSATATVDLRVLIEPASWDAEYGGLIEYADLFRLVEEVGRRT